jgi:NAD(P)-dependent dehydrogenase (short-subunit alcohol dehydrogenase family)
MSTASQMPKWTTSKIPPQAGRVAVVTGASGGLGYETALALGQAGADVILAVRNEGKATVALEKIRTLAPTAKVQFRLLDLSSLKSVRGFADRVSGEHGQLDVLVNNAAVMALSRHQLTVDGFEMQFGTNYLGHFALTGLLFPLLRRTAGARVISLSSLAHRRGIIDLADLQAVKSYRPWKAYSQSKLAMLILRSNCNVAARLRDGVSAVWRPIRAGPPRI